MCGICGIVYKDRQRPVAPELLSGNHAAIAAWAWMVMVHPPKPFYLGDGELQRASLGLLRNLCAGPAEQALNCCI